MVDFTKYNYCNSIGNRDQYDFGLTSRYILRRNSCLPTEGASSIPILLGDGTMAYINTKIKVENSHGSAKATKKPLLGRPMHDLMKQVETLEKRALKRKRKACLEGDEHLVDETKDSDINVSTEWHKDFEFESSATEDKSTSINLPIPRGLDTPAQLWVDKYSPRFFSDLLSDEKINREVLRALREWDPYVFRKSAPVRPTTTVTTSSISYGHTNKGNKKSTATAESKQLNIQDTGNDDIMAKNLPPLKSQDVRPASDKRVILLSGPPGMLANC